MKTDLPADLARPRDPERARLIATLVLGAALAALDVALVVVSLHT
jgi:hypothetical protein